MGTPTRFKNGVTNAAVNSIFGNLPTLYSDIHRITQQVHPLFATDPSRALALLAELVSN